MKIWVLEIKQSDPSKRGLILDHNYRVNELAVPESCKLQGIICIKTGQLGVKGAGWTKYYKYFAGFFFLLKEFTRNWRVLEAGQSWDINMLFSALYWGGWIKEGEVREGGGGGREMERG